MSKVFDMDIDGQSEKVLPRDVAYDPVSDEPIHLDFLRIVKGSKLILEVPVKFINADKSPGLKKGGVLNIVRRKVELKCPTENIACLYRKKHRAKKQIWLCTFLV